MGETHSEPDEGLGPMWGIVLIGWFIVLGSAFLTWQAGSKWRLAAASDSFATAEGTVVLSGIRERGGTDYVRAVVIVGYDVEGEHFELNVSGKDGLSERELDPHSFVLSHPVGQSLNVFYDPDSPGRSALLREISWAREAVLAGCGLLLSGVFLAWGWRRRKADRTSPAPE